MQNRYAGDVGDFGKYGLLRSLSGQLARDEDANLRLGVVWYLVPNEDHNEDGKFTSYLTPTRHNLRDFRDCDPELYDALAQVIHDQDRNVLRIQADGILPGDTSFYSGLLTFEGMPNIGAQAQAQRLLHREDWLNGALDATGDSAIVFFDPDNGFEVRTERHRKTGPKYAFFDEVLPFVRRRQSVVVYQHIGRTGGTATDQIQGRFAQLRQFLPNGCNPFAVLYHRGNCRAFFVLPVAGHHDILLRRVQRMLEGSWSRNFDLILEV